MGEKVGGGGGGVARQCQNSRAKPGHSLGQSIDHPIT